MTPELLKIARGNHTKFDYSRVREIGEILENGKERLAY